MSDGTCGGETCVSLLVSALYRGLGPNEWRQIARFEMSGGETCATYSIWLLKRFKIRHSSRNAWKTATHSGAASSIGAETDAGIEAAGDSLSAIAPARRVVEVSGGTWTFRGFDRESVVADASTSDSDGNMIFVAIREFAEKDDASSGSGSSSEGGARESPAKDGPRPGCHRRRCHGRDVVPRTPMAG